MHALKIVTISPVKLTAESSVSHSEEEQGFPLSVHEKENSKINGIKKIYRFMLFD